MRPFRTCCKQTSYFGANQHMWEITTSDASSASYFLSCSYFPNIQLYTDSVWSSSAICRHLSSLSLLYTCIGAKYTEFAFAVMVYGNFLTIRKLCFLCKFKSNNTIIYLTFVNTNNFKNMKNSQLGPSISYVLRNKAP